jgi:lipopolysaccharide export system permease protein
VKKIHVFIIKSFIGPFVVTFTISMLFLIMQFLWKYVDDIMGKGVEISVILKLLFYTSANIIPMALPIAVLFSSIMTMGNLAESNELTSMKSSGMSLFKVMRPLLVFMVGLSILTFYFSNYILPIANLKQRTMIWDITEKKPAFSLTEGVFYGDIPNYLIKVDKKDPETGDLYGVLIYKKKPLESTIRAKKGELISSENEQFLLLKLTDGAMYEEAGSGITGKKRVSPYQKSFFKESVVKFDMSTLNFQKSDEELFKREYQMMNYAQLGTSIDSFKVEIDSIDRVFETSFLNETVVFNNNFLDTIRLDSTGKANGIVVPTKTTNIISLDSLNKTQLNSALVTSQNSLRAKKDFIRMNAQLSSMRNKSLTEYKTEWHRKFTLSFAIIVLFFIGAPLGAIIKKGGLGAPLIFATLFFLLYYIISITGENMIESSMLEPLTGMWISSFVLVPIGLF